jgi:hypothetical protein
VDQVVQPLPSKYKALKSTPKELFLDIKSALERKTLKPLMTTGSGAGMPEVKSYLCPTGCMTLGKLLKGP